MRPLKLTLILLFAGQIVAASQIGPWDMDRLFEAPAWKRTDTAAQPGMTGILYSSIPYKGKPVDVFAYYSAPEGKPPQGGWPAVVCVHGGGGTSFHQWVKVWNDHGYAAISMDLEGHYPIREKEERGSPRDSTPNPGPSRVGIFHDFEEPVREQWYYHAVAQAILAHSLIRSFPEVNADKTGVTGISWGGTLTSTIMGVDNRFKFAIPVYGCGFLPDSDGNQGESIKPGKQTEFVYDNYDGSAFFHNVRIPTLWVNGTNDKHFPMPSTQDSASAIIGPAAIRYELEMRHGHYPGWEPKEIYAFADSIVQGKTPLATIGKPKVTIQGRVEVSYSSETRIQSAKLLYTKDNGVWAVRKWMEAPADVSESTLTAAIPEGAKVLYFNATDERGLMVSSQFIELTPVRESTFVQSLVPGKFILPAEDGWWTWCMAPIYDEEGKLHIFNSAIPTKGRWTIDSEIRHYVADSVEGPYRLVDTPFKSDTATYHNPQVSKVGDTYVLVYLWKISSTDGRAQEIGIATAKSLYGPWKESPHNPIIRASGTMDGANILHASNPTFVVDAEGKYRIYYKSMTDKYLPATYREISLAISDNIEGPYENYPGNPLISYANEELDIEDPYAFYYKGMYYMIVEDRRAVKNMLEGKPLPAKEIKSGGNRPGLIYRSRDGITWERPEVGYQTNEFYYGHKLARTERPHILWKDGEPEYLFLACHDDDPTAGFYLKIRDWDAAKPAHYPEFSWDYVPRYMHMRKSEAFTQEELQYLSKFPIITLEKTTGMGTYGSTEQGSREAAKGIKAINPKAKVLYYRNIIVHYSGYQVNDSLDTIDEPLLTDASGNAMIVHGGIRGAYDLTNTDLQEWWLEHCLEMARHPGIDGIFIDGNIKALEPAFLKREVGEAKKAEVAQAYEQMMHSLDGQIGNDDLLIANLIRARLPNSGLDYLKHFDGSYIEAFESEANGLTKVEYVSKGIAAVQRAARDGKIICFSMGLGEALNVGLRIDDTRAKLEQGSDAQERLTYALAIFLICAEKYSYFLPHDGYSVNRNDSSVWLKDFPEFEKPLGPPLAPAVQDGYIYTRRFKHASVWLDIEHETARIDWYRE